MNPPDLKKGQAYLILADYHGKDCDGDFVFIAESTERRLFLPFVAVQNCVFLPSEPPTSVGSHPKYDPCRKFRKGDIVQVVERHGRNTPLEKIVTDIHGLTFTVLMDEDSDNDVLIETSKGDRFIQFSYLKLVTPVEELEPYGVAYNIHGWIVYKENPGNVIANFNNTHPHAKEAAEAERDRLNADYRKEQS